MTQSSEQLSKCLSHVGSTLSLPTHVKRVSQVSQRSDESRGFSPGAPGPVVQKWVNLILG